MSERPLQKVARLGARGVIGAIVTVCVVGGVAAASVLPTPKLEAPAPASKVAPEAGPLALVCPESFVVGGRDAASAASLSVAANGSLTTAGADAAASASTPLKVQNADGAAVTTQSFTPAAGAVADLAGTVSTKIADPDASGFAVAACRPALTQSWVAGINTSVGASGVLVLSNPGQVAATVKLTVFGLEGPKVPAGAEGIVVEPGATVLRSVASFVDGQETPVVRVDSAGAPVQATLQSTTVRGLTATGIDVQTSMAGAAKQAVIPGLRVARVSGGVASTLRLLSPEVAQSVQVKVTPTGKTEPTSTLTASLQAGIPVQMQLEGLPPGTYSLSVSGSAPVLASAWQSTGFGAGGDEAWFEAAPEITAPASTAIAGGAGATLYIANPGTKEVSVAVTTTAGKQDVKIAAGSSAGVAAPQGSVTIDPKNVAVHAAVTYARGLDLASATMWAPNAAATPVLVTR